jgi:hypothetical protein
MELDLQGLVGLHVHSCTHLLRPRKPSPNPLSPVFGLVYDGAIGQWSLGKIDDISLHVTPKREVREPCEGIHIRKACK